MPNNFEIGTLGSYGFSMAIMVLYRPLLVNERNFSFCKLSYICLNRTTEYFYLTAGGYNQRNMVQTWGIS